MIKRGYLVVLLMLAIFAAYFLMPVRREVMTNAVVWWNQWVSQLDAIQANLVPDRRGLNLAVLSPSGELVAARAFDTYLRINTGFAEFVRDISPGNWVIIAVRDDAATSLTGRELAALQSLGGTGRLRGRTHWAYVLVGRANLGVGRGFERLDRRRLEIKFTKGQRIGGSPLPVALQLRSYGFDAGPQASVQVVGRLGFRNLLRWLKVVWRRM